jgi:simple sugar transport system ATP-binding protein
MMIGKELVPCQRPKPMANTEDTARLQVHSLSRAASHPLARRYRTSAPLIPGEILGIAGSVWRPAGAMFALSGEDPSAARCRHDSSQWPPVAHLNSRRTQGLGFVPRNVWDVVRFQPSLAENTLLTAYDQACCSVV